MGHDDLERRLRTERGPREAGYAPADLPATIEERARPRRAAAVMRVGLLAGAAMAALVAVAIVSGLGRGGNVSVGGGGSGSPTATPSTVATPTPVATTGGACLSGDVVLTAEPWGGAAGSRGTVVTVALADGATPCDVATAPRGRMVDGSQSHLVASDSSAAGMTRLEAGVSYTVGVAWSNWCDPAPAGPIGLELQLDGWSWTPVPASGGADPVPPCMGSAPTSLSVTELQPAQ
jgi:hypothetical protein